MILEIKSGSAIAKIDTKGAELVSFVDVFGAEYIWCKDAKYWGRCSPTLFPIVGNLRNGKTIINGKEYEIEKHGFCRDCEFKVIYQGQDKVMLNYTFNEETLKIYPYKFSLTLTYTIVEAQLMIKYDVANLGDEEMDYCLGAHPAFNIPLAGNGEFEEYCIEFEQEEVAYCPVYDEPNLEFNMNNTKLMLNNEKRIMLKYDLFKEDAILFDNIKSKKVKLYNVKTGRGIEVDYDTFDYVAFWTPSNIDSPFLCIEPWCGMAVCNDEDDNYTSKRGVKHLDKGEQNSHRLFLNPM